MGSVLAFPLVVQAQPLEMFEVTERDTRREDESQLRRLAHSRPDAPRYQPGDMIRGKYRLERLLGEGGAGTVWLAHNELLDTSIAIKLVRSGPDSIDAGLRLLDEARVEAKLEHPAVVRVYDYGETDLGDPFIVMELLEGTNLASHLRARGKLAPAMAVQLILPVIDGLQRAHDAGIVHRDLKPENLFLAHVGPRVQPKVVDFGIAKVCDPRDKRITPRRTLAGCVLGTPAYMAPEQARGLSNVDWRADIWALCVVLYETVTGELPFDGESYNAILRAVIEEECVPLKYWGINEPELARIVHRGLAKDRTARYQSMRELGNELASWLKSRGVNEDITGDALGRTWTIGRRRSPLTRRNVVLSTCATTIGLAVAAIIGLTEPAAAEGENTRLRRMAPAVARYVPVEFEETTSAGRPRVQPALAATPVEESAAPAANAPAEPRAVRATQKDASRKTWATLVPRNVGNGAAPVARDGNRRAALSELKVPYR